MPATPAVGRVGVLGAGVMGEALVAAAVRGGVPAGDLEVAEPSADRAAEVGRRHGVTTTDDVAAVVSRADVVLVAVKPGDMDDLLEQVRGALRTGTLVVTVAAGLPIAFYEQRLPGGTPVVRVMPNTPAVIGEGAGALAGGTHATRDHVAVATALLAATGTLVEVPEKHLDAVTAVSGSGPAYVFYLVDALAEAGVLLGLPRAQALELAVATFRGSAGLLGTGEHPAILRERVSSPGGTTVAGLRELDAHGVRAGIVAAAVAAYERSRELGAAQAPPEARPGG